MECPLVGGPDWWDGWRAPMDPVLSASFRRCRTLTARHARSFHFASFALPRARKDAACAIYAFCRMADDLIDEGGGLEADTAGARLDRLFDAALAGRLDGAGPAFAATVREFAIEKRWFLELMEGVRRDTGRVRIQTWDELRDYCWHVASVVGLMMAPVLGLRDPAGRAHAEALGIAMQLTNILRDVREDLERDRVYLPAEELRRFGVSEADLTLPDPSPAFVALLKFQIDRARHFYTAAEPGIPMLAADGSQFTAWLMRHVYAGILEEIERADYAVGRGRVRTGFGRKLMLAGRAWRDLRRNRA